MIRICIIEDEKPIANLIRMSLSRSGYQCTCIHDGIEAANLLEQQNFDLVLLDIMLPGADGYALVLIGYDDKSYYFCNPQSEEAVVSYPKEACETAYNALYSQAVIMKPAA